MEALRDSKVLPEEGKKTMTTTRSSKPDIPPVVSMDWNLHIKDCSSQ